MMTVTRPEAHLAPRQRVAHERRRHHHDEDEHADDPQHLARRLVGAVVEAAEDMDVGGEEEHRGADRVQVADQPAEVHVAADALDGIEGRLGARLVVHGQHDAGDDLRDEHEGQDAAERPQIIEVARRREVDELRVHHAARSAVAHPSTCRISSSARKSIRAQPWGAAPSADLDLGVGQETRRPAPRDCAAQAPYGCVRPCRSASRGRGRANRRSRPCCRRAPAPWGCSRDGCRCRP